MAARPRIRKRASWPANLHEPRPSYYVWRDPRDGKTHVLGRIPLAQAIHEAHEANVIVENGKISRSLADRVSREQGTVAELIAKMPTEGLSANTIRARGDCDKVINAALGTRECATLTTRDVADLLEPIKERGKLRWAQVIRTRMIAIFNKGLALGWMERNPAIVTEKVRNSVKRKRLTLEQFNLILDKAPEVASWLPNAMLLALVSGQDRSTIGAWERSFIVDGHAELQRSKTKIRISIPLELRMDAVGMSLGEIIARCKSTGVVSKYLIHHVRSRGVMLRGQPVHLNTISAGFAESRRLAGIPEEGAPTFHEIRSLSKRLYMEQGNIDTKALLGHMTDAMADLYANSRGVAPIKVRINAA